MVCRGGPWKVPWYVVEDAVEGFAAGGATACHGMSPTRTLVYTPHTPLLECLRQYCVCDFHCSKLNYRCRFKVVVSTESGSLNPANSKAASLQPHTSTPRTLPLQTRASRHAKKRYFRSCVLPFKR